MTKAGAISHRYAGEQDIPRRAARAGANFDLIQENLAAGSTPDSIYEKWANTSGTLPDWLNPVVNSMGVATVSLNGVLYAVAEYAHSVPAKKLLTQTQVEAAVGALIRAQGLIILQNNADARHLCSGGTMVSSMPTFRVVWQSSDLTQLPDSLMKSLTPGRFSRASVGSCPATDPDGRSDSYRVEVLLYSEGVGLY